MKNINFIDNQTILEEEEDALSVFMRPWEDSEYWKEPDDFSDDFDITEYQFNALLQDIADGNHLVIKRAEIVAEILGFDESQISDAINHIGKYDNSLH